MGLSINCFFCLPKVQGLRWNPHCAVSRKFFILRSHTPIVSASCSALLDSGAGWRLGRQPCQCMMGLTSCAFATPSFSANAIIGSTPSLCAPHLFGVSSTTARDPPLPHARARDQDDGSYTNLLQNTMECHSEQLCFYITRHEQWYLLVQRLCII